jgi:hypothetical protein
LQLPAGGTDHPLTETQEEDVADADGTGLPGTAATRPAARIIRQASALTAAGGLPDSSAAATTTAAKVTVETRPAEARAT